jgi:long-chain acyl-CoA synthetase
MTLVDVLQQNASRFPDRTALVQDDLAVTFGQWHAQARALAAHLAATGLRKGDRVGLLMHKTPQAMIAFLGIAAAGGVFFTLDFNQRPDDLQFVLDLTRPHAMIVDPEFLPLLARLEHGCGKHLVFTREAGAPAGGTTWTGITDRPPEPAPAVDADENDVVHLNFTSGTTGRPRAAATTHANIRWNTIASIEALGLREDDVHLSMFPIYGHPHELFARSLYLGGTSVLVNSVSPRVILKAMTRLNVTAFMAVGSIYAELVRHCRRHPVRLPGRRSTWRSATRARTSGPRSPPRSTA